MNEELDKYRCYVPTEAVLTSWIRNTIIIFTGSIAIINFSKNKNKILFAILLSLSGIIIGFTSLYEYYVRIQHINNGRYDLIQKSSYTRYVTLVTLILFSILVMYRFIMLNKKHKFL